MQSELFTAPKTGEYVPEGQLKQDERPVSLPYVPAKQRLHVEALPWPSAVEKV